MLGFIDTPTGPIDKGIGPKQGTDLNLVPGGLVTANRTWTKPHILCSFIQTQESEAPMPGSEYEKVMDLAADQFGYVSTSQAVARGVSNNALRMMATRGVLERVSWGVYRVPTFPASPLAEYTEASLWPAGVPGVVSHESALAIRDLSDVNPARVHITLPRGFRVRRKVPGHLTIHNAELSEDEIDLVEGIPTTTVRRTIEDCHRAKLGPTLLRQAIDEAQREGYLEQTDAVDLRALVKERTRP
jgi:predicted transcriptional regulator of viral defense system